MTIYRGTNLGEFTESSPTVYLVNLLDTHPGNHPDPSTGDLERNGSPVPMQTAAAPSSAGCDVRSFLGLANYYRCFIKNFARLAAPLTRLTRKDVKFQWDHSCATAFDQLKRALTSAPILAYPDFHILFDLYVDASQDGLGMVLGQTQDGNEVVIAYSGRELNRAERNYSATEREALSVVEGIKKFQTYLYGHHFVVHTDHHSLTWLMRIEEPTGRLARWSVLLQQYDFEICDRSGQSNGNADRLSRRPYPVPLAAIDTLGLQTERVRNLQHRDADLSDTIAYLKDKTLPAKDSSARALLLCVDNYFLDKDGILCHIWVPNKRYPRVCTPN